METAFYKRTPTPSGFETRRLSLNQNTIDNILLSPSSEALTSIFVIQQNKSFTLSEYITHIKEPQDSKSIKRLSDEDRLQVIDLLSCGLSVRKVADRLGCSKSSVSRIKQGLEVA